jgi:hypothetical protein
MLKDTNRTSPYAIYLVFLQSDVRYCTIQWIFNASTCTCFQYFTYTVSGCSVHVGLSTYTDILPAQHIHIATPSSWLLSAPTSLLSVAAHDQRAYIHTQCAYMSTYTRLIHPLHGC